jgi:hypothetical protein
MMGVLVEVGAGGAPVILTLVSGNVVRELMKNKINSAVAGTPMKSTNTMTPRRVKRK